MTDAEIRTELQKQIEAGGAEGRIARLDARPNCPPMIVVCRHRLTAYNLENIRLTWTAGWTDDGAIPKAMIFDPDFELYQLVDGRWQHLKPDAR